MLATGLHRPWPHLRGARIGFVFQCFNLISQLNVVEHIEIPMYYRGFREREKPSIRWPDPSPSAQDDKSGARANQESRQYPKAEALSLRRRSATPM
jgi:hypothetical protein